MHSSLTLRRAGLAAVAVASVFLLSACNPSPRAIENFDGLPVSDHEGDADGHTDEGASDEGLSAAWVGQGGQIAITISGSSTCPVVGTRINVVDDADSGNRVSVDVQGPADDEVCTMDFVPHTTVFWTPVFVTTTQPLVVEVGDQSFTLPIK
ncbi:hypothetical protein SAMN05428970_2986 [Agromyces sp. CF514]|uniref:hypothetical protein n=1 Tax=Agromyces sp. CF514 TaxID=1881031 RepID=UPI0008DFD6F7|nr:hypothetical protein [Agromyces sp. CF514]SFR84397.1 hypothetical protein SAMN05428970_2986 [Agromyces sp. CF514]